MLNHLPGKWNSYNNNNKNVLLDWNNTANNAIYYESVKYQLLFFDQTLNTQLLKQDSSFVSSDLLCLLATEAAENIE